MELVAAYPIVVTDRFRECRDFHTRWFGLEVVFEADWIAVLSAGGGVPAVAFMHSRSSRPRRRRRGPTTATECSSRCRWPTRRRSTSGSRAAGLSFDLELKDEPWGQRRFGVVDPSGMWVDVVEQIEPAPGWWEPYLS